MVSDMESDELRESLRHAERGEASTWIDHPPVPVWWAPLFGVWSFVFGLAIAYVDGFASSLIDLALALVMVGLIMWQRRWRGTYPTGRMPRELVPSLLALVGWVLVLALVAWLVGSTTTGWAAAIVAGAGAWVLVAWYEAAFARDAQKIRARLA